MAVRAFQLFHAALVPEMQKFPDPAERLAAMTRGYVRFAADHRSLFEMLYESGVDKARHPEIEAAEQPIDDAFMECVRALSGGDDALSEDLATAIEATAYGHAMLLLDSGPGPDEKAVELAAERTARATLALVQGRRLLGQPSPRPVR